MNLPIRAKGSAEAASIEISIRAWARRDTMARAAVEEVDKYRLSFIKRIFKELGHSDIRANDLAHLLYSYIVATSLIRFDENLEEQRAMAARIAEFLVSSANGAS